MGKEQVAVIILNYKSWNDTLSEAKLVHDLFELNWQQIIIVDNASPNDSEAMLKNKKIGDYIFIESGENKGYAAGNNVGLRYAYNHGYKYGWILNNDILIEDKDLLRDMLNVMNSDDYVAAINPDIYSPEGHMFNRDAIKMSLFDMTIGLPLYKKKGRKIIDLGNYGYVYRPQGCCMLLDLVKGFEVGFLDENTFLYCEEPIYAERLLTNNWKCACLINRKVIHNHSKTVKSSLTKRNITKVQNKSFEYYLKNYRHFNWLSRKLALSFNFVKNMILD